MPSFTLVLTSGHCSHPRHPTTIRFDTLSTASDHLMKTIDFRDELEDDHGHDTNVSTTSISQEDINFPVIKEAELSSSASIAKDTGHPAKTNLFLFLHKCIGKLALVKKTSST